MDSIPNPTGDASDAASADMAPPATPSHQSTVTTSDVATANSPFVGASQISTPAVMASQTAMFPDQINVAPPPAPETLPPPNQSADTTAIGDAGGATMTALADDLQYTLTVGQVLERFGAARRKVPSERSVQRYCIDGQLAAQKIRTTYGSEWLINETSLEKLIEAQPEVSAVASDAASSDVAPTASPFIEKPQNTAPDTTATGAASDAVVKTMAAPEGERRTIADVLIENARLVAQVEGKDAIIEELKEDRSFLREEIRHGRTTRDDVKNIAERMLDTLKTMAIGRLPSAPLRDEPLRPEFVERTDQRSG